MPAEPQGAIGSVAQCVVLLRVSQLADRLFDYRVPEELLGQVGLGSVVAVPFGHRKARAVVVGRSSPEGAVEDLKDILAVEPDTIPPELLELARVLADRYLCSFESCVRLVVPPQQPGRAGRPPRVRRDWITRADAEGAAPAAGEPGPVGEGTLLPATGARLTVKQRAALDLIPEGGLPAERLLRLAGVGRTVLRALEQKGLITRGPAPAGVEGADGQILASSVVGVAAQAVGHVGPTLPGTSDQGREPTLWPEQAAAVSSLTAALGKGTYSHHVLWGVTGSGKTEVYLRLLGQVLEQGGGAILLVPEIALTPQTVERVCSRFGAQVAVFHSGLPLGERLREYRRVRAGEAAIVVGARSAVFAPVPDLRLVIIDEAHDTSYKQEEEPRYEVRTVAELRLKPVGGLLVEGSATPSVESLAKAASTLRLTRRAAGSTPEVEVVDMRRQGAGLLLAPRSREALAEVLRRGEQAIILLNRRGYAGYVHCELCGHVMVCDSCELSLTYHGRERRLVCHHCGRAYAQPSLCPVCGEATLSRAAPGTERLDAELRRFVPQGRVFRLDSDVVSNAVQAQQVLGAFSQARPGVLVGTQMVAKGHDFPEVTLVLVADADTGLYVPDFRAAERTFQLLTQVAGRAGRADRPGKVLVQTWNPEVPCIRMALDRDEAGFYRQELTTRSRLGYPPFSELIRLVVLSTDSDKARAGAHYLVERLVPYFQRGEVRGPARLPMLRGKERWQVVVAARDGARARVIVKHAGAQLKQPYRQRGVLLVIDVDPQSFL
jgi:primosomal protein N' (replication factor Y)